MSDNTPQLHRLGDPRHLIPFLQVKVQTANQNGAMIVSYVDARDKGEIADRVLGPGNWSNRISQHPVCVGGSDEQREWVASATVTVGRMIHEDSGSGTGGLENGMKGAASDAIKRAWVHFGLGRPLYYLSRQWADTFQNARGKWDVSKQEKERIKQLWIKELEQMGIEWEQKLSPHLPDEVEVPEPEPAPVVPPTAPEPPADEPKPMSMMIGGEEPVPAEERPKPSGQEDSLTIMKAYVDSVWQSAPQDYVRLTKDDIVDLLQKQDPQVTPKMFKAEPDRIYDLLKKEMKDRADLSYAVGQNPALPDVPAGPNMSKRRREAA